MTLVLLPPIGLDAGCWEGLEPPGVRVAKHTFPGFGGRARAGEQPTMASLADEVAASYDPPLDLAQLANGQGAIGHGPVRTVEALGRALEVAIGQVLGGATCVIDVRVAPEYARAVSSALLRNIPNDH